MAFRATTRGITTGAATTLALSALTLLGGGIAHADPASVSWDDQGTHFTRTVSADAPKAGDTITVTTQFSRTSGEAKINWIKDFHDRCLTYVKQSAKITDGSGDHAVEPHLEVQGGFVAGDFAATSYKIAISPTSSPTLSVQYTVGANCSTTTPLTSGVAIALANSAPKNYSDKGPKITVGTADDPATNPGTNPGGGTDPGTTPGTDPGTKPGTNPGTDPGTKPGTDPGTKPGTKPGGGTGSSTGSGILDSLLEGTGSLGSLLGGSGSSK